MTAQLILMLAFCSETPDINGQAGNACMRMQLVSPVPFSLEGLGILAPANAQAMGLHKSAGHIVTCQLNIATCGNSCFVGLQG